MKSAKAQTTLSQGDILFTTFDATPIAGAGDSFSFVLLKPVASGTVISFTDRGFHGNSTWQAAGSTESTITWTSGSAIAMGTEVYIVGLTAKTYNATTSTVLNNGTVTLTEGSSTNGLSLSNVGDQIIAFQGGNGSITRQGAYCIAGINYFYTATSTTAGWNIGAPAGPNSSLMPPGLTGGTSAFYTGPVSSNLSPSSGKFKCSAIPAMVNAENLRTAIMNITNWELSTSSLGQLSNCNLSGVLLNANPTLIFNSSTGLEDFVATDGDGGSTIITDFDLQIYNISNVDGTNENTLTWRNNSFLASGDSNFSALTMESDQGSKGMLIKSSNGANFKLHSFKYYNWGETSEFTNTVKGYRDGLEVTSYTFEGLGDNFIPFTVTLPSSFYNVDEVRLYISAGGFQEDQSATNHGINNIQVGPAEAGNTPPVASSVSNTGTLTVGQILTGSYTYTDAESNADNGSTYKWYRSDNASGLNKTAIASATSKTYTLVTADVNKYISFEVTPKDGTAFGTAVESTRRGPIIAASTGCTISSLIANLETQSGIDYLHFGQSFTACQDGQLSKIKFLSGMPGGSYNQDLVITIRQGEGLSGNILGTVTLSKSSIVDATHATHFTVANVSSSNISVVNGQTYTFSFDGNDNNRAYLYFGGSASIYSGGRLFVGTEGLSDYDLIFEVEIEPSSAPVNSAPILTMSNGTTAYTQGTPKAIDNALTIADADNLSLESATVTISGNFNSGQDVLRYVNQNGITGIYNSGTGVLSLSGSSSVANYQAALRSVTYNNTSISPNTSSRTITFVVNDGVASSTAKTKTVSVTALSTNANLTNLVLSAGTLSSTFNSNTTNYTVIVSNTTSSLTITPTLAEANASVKVNGVAINSGSASSAISLVEGNNTINVVVTAQDGTTTKTYEITVLKAMVAPGNALSFDGANDYVEIGNASTFDARTMKTIEAWVKFNSFSGTQEIISKSKSSNGIELIIYGSNLSIYTMGGQDLSVSYPTSNLQTNKWYHIAATHNGPNSTLRLYVNGVSVGTPITTPDGMTNSTGPLNLGRWADTENRYFNGSLDEVRIWDFERTQTQIQSGMLGVIDPTTSGLLAYYSFDQGIAGGTNTTITSLKDKTANLNHGVLTNFTLSGTNSNWVSSNAFVINSAPTAISLSGTSANQSGGVNATVGTLSTTDADQGDTFTYSLVSGSGDTNNASFNISGSTLRANNSGSLTAGNYSVRVRTADAGGATFEKVFSLTIVDDIKPTVTSIIRNSTETTNASTVNYTVTFSESVTGVDRNDFSIIGTATATGTVFLVSGSGLSYTVTVNTISGDGTLRLDLKSSGTGIQDAAGNAIASGYSSGETYAIDNTAPNAPSIPDLATSSDSGTSSTDNITNVTAPTFTGTAEAGSTVTLYSGSTSIGTATATGGNWSITASTLSAGSHTITAKATDAVGNISTASNALTVTIDNTLPEAPSTPDLAVSSDSGTSDTDNITNITTPTFTGTAESGSRVRLYNGLTLLGTATATDGTWSITTPTLAGGNYTITAQASDAAGNVSTASSALNVTIDVTAPSQPGTPYLTAASDAGNSNTDNITNITTPTFSGTETDGNLITLYSGTTIIGTATVAGGEWSITASTLSEGSHSITIAITDVAGNESTASNALTVTIDTTPPTTPSTPDLAASSDSGISSTDNITNATTPTFTGTAEAGNTVTLYSGSTLIGTATATGGNWNITTSTLSAGSHTITAKATDVAGNVAASNALTVTIDVTAPTLSISKDFDYGLTVGQTTIVTFTFSEDPGTTFTESDITVTGGSLSDFSVSGLTRTVKFTPTANTDNATGGVAVSAGSYTDAAGNSGGAGSLAIPYDTKAPAAPVLTATHGNGKVTLTWTGSSESDLNVYKIYRGQNGVSFYDVIDAPASTYVDTDVTNGTTYSYEVVAQDLGYNETKSNRVSATPKGTQTITFTSLATKTYGDASFSLGNANSSADLAITYTAEDPSVVSISGSQATILKAGTTKITASQGGNGTYEAAPSVEQTLTVNKKALTATAQAVTKVYDGNANATITFNALTGLVGSDDVTVSYTSASYNNKHVATNKAITISGLTLIGDKKDNYSLNAFSTTGTVSQKPINVTAQEDTKVYDGTTASSIIPIVDDLITGDVISTQPTQVFANKHVANSKTLIPSGLVITDGNNGGNYNITYVRGLGIVTAKPINVTAQADAKEYDGITTSAIVPIVDNLATGDLVATAPTQSYTNKHTGTGKTLTPAGFVINDGNSGANYNVSYVVNTNGVITTKPINVTAQADTKVYDGTTTSAIAPTVDNLATGDLVSTAPTQAYTNKHIGTGKTLTPAGLVINDGNSGANYNVSYVTNINGVITTKPINVTAQTDTKVYDGTTTSAILPIVDNLATGDIIITPATQSYNTKNTGTGITLTPAGLVINDGNSGANYHVTYISNTSGVITSATLSYVATPATKVYGDANPSFTGTVTGFASGDDLTNATTGTLEFTTSANNSSSIGTYAINGGGLTAENYTFVQAASNSTALTVTARPITITADAKDKIYGDADPALSYQITSGNLVNGDDFTGSLSRQVGEAAGTYSINQNSVALSTNYNLSYQGATLTIDKAILMVTANSAERCYGDNNPAFSVTYNGFKFSDNASSLTTVPTVITTATFKSVAGNYALIASGGISSNYAFDYVNGILTVNPLPVNTIVSNKGLSISKGETAVLTVNSDNGISYRWDDAAGILGGTGSQTLTVRPMENTIYTVTVRNANGCESMSTISIEVKEDYQALVKENFITPNGDGVNDTWVIENIDAYPDHTLTIVDRSGKVLHKVRNYGNDWNGTVDGAPLAPGTYYYFINFDKAGSRPIKGFITIVRQ